MMISKTNISVISNDKDQLFMQYFNGTPFLIGKAGKNKHAVILQLLNTMESRIKNLETPNAIKTDKLGFSKISEPEVKYLKECVKHVKILLQNL